MNGHFYKLFLVGFLALVPLVMAQKSGTTGTGSGAPGGNTSASGTPTTVNGSRGTINNPNNNPNNNNGNTGIYDQTRPIFLAGSVLFDDGTSPTSEIRIERVCNGNSHLETHTDSKGRFSFQIGGEPGSSISDASASESLNDSGFGGARNTGFGRSQGSGLGSGSQNLAGCELRAAYPGYVSDSVDLSMRHSMDDPKLGTIILHHLGNVKGTTISVTTAAAPKSAQKSFEKGNLLAQKGKFEEAEQKFASATSDYPKFAAAWFGLGQVQQRLNKPDDAKKSYLAAVAADEHYVSPWDQLALLSEQQGKWQDAADFSRKATDLNPVEFPSSFWYNALANYNLQKNVDAEKSVRALIKLDSRHKYPQAEAMLSEFAANRGDLDDAASHLKAYLAMAPNASNAAALKGELARMEQTRAAQAKNTPGAAPP